MRPPPSNARDGSHGRTRQYVPGSDKRPLPVRGSKAPKAALKGRGPPFPSAGERGPPRPHKPTAGFRKGREAPHPRTGRPAPVRGTPISARPPFAEGQLRVNEIPWRQHGGQCVPKCARQAGAVANGPCERRQHGRHVTDASEACRHDYFHASPGRKTPAEAPPGNHMHLEREVRPGTCAEEDCAAGISRARWTAGRSSAPLRLLGDASCFRRNGSFGQKPGLPVSTMVISSLRAAAGCDPVRPTTVSRSGAMSRTVGRKDRLQGVSRLADRCPTAHGLRVKVG